MAKPVSQSDRNLFGAVSSAPTEKTAKGKAKTLPKASLPPSVVVETVFEPATAAPKSLTAEQRLEADANRKKLLAGRNAWKIGDTRDAESDCPACGCERFAVLEHRTPQSGQTWVAFCVNKQCVRCPDYGLEMTR